jgi:hypothetical protein
MLQHNCEKFGLLSCLGVEFLPRVALQSRFISLVCAAKFSSTCSTQSDNISWKLRLPVFLACPRPKVYLFKNLKNIALPQSHLHISVTGFLWQVQSLNTRKTVIIDVIKPPVLFLFHIIWKDILHHSFLHKLKNVSALCPVTHFSEPEHFA